MRSNFGRKAVLIAALMASTSMAQAEDVAHSLQGWPALARGDMPKATLHIHTKPKV